jgi:tRNA dimethylallyltransferase
LTFDTPSAARFPDPIFLVGPTASGKSAVALALAEQLSAEIVSVDSMQVYRGLDLGTAKPGSAERARVPHHLVDVLNLDEEFDAARFIVMAQAAALDISARGKRPIFCGGTGLYLKAFLFGLGQTPRSDPLIRQELEKAPLADLLRELEAKDPATFARIDQKNPRRVIRAVEVLRQTGESISSLQAAWLPPTKSINTRFLFGLNRPMGELRQRIDQRVDQMFATGLVAETQALIEKGLPQNRAASQALGYRQVIEHLQGHRSLPETIELVKIRTRQFAKRQMTWFHRQLTVRWFNVHHDTPPEATAEQLAEIIKTCPSKGLCGAA